MIRRIVRVALGGILGAGLAFGGLQIAQPEPAAASAANYAGVKLGNSVDCPWWFPNGENSPPPCSMHVWTGEPGDAAVNYLKSANLMYCTNRSMVPASGTTYSGPGYCEMVHSVGVYPGTSHAHFDRTNNVYWDGGTFRDMDFRCKFATVHYVHGYLSVWHRLTGC